MIEASKLFIVAESLGLLVKTIINCIVFFFCDGSVLYGEAFKQQRVPYKYRFGCGLRDLRLFTHHVSYVFGVQVICPFVLLFCR